MTHTVTINPQNNQIVINNLVIRNDDLAALLLTEPEEKHEQCLLGVIAVGSTALQRLRATIDVDFVEKRFSDLANTFERTLSEVEGRAIDSLSKRFSPTEAGSYTKLIGELIADAKRDVHTWNKELENSSRSLLDPDKKTSGINKLSDVLQDATQQFKDLFDPTITTSYSHQLNERLTQIFGNGTQGGVLKAALQEAMKPVLGELQEVKERIEAKKSADQVIALTPLKGKPFEDEIQSDLAKLAQPFGDDVQFVGDGANGSKAGDFLLTFSSLNKTVVVEARNRRQGSLPAIKIDLDKELAARSADFAIYVAAGAEMLPQHVGAFQIYGNKVVTTQQNLPIAYRLTRVLASMASPAGTVDTGAVRSVLGRIQDVAKQMRDIRSKATQATKSVEQIYSVAEASELAIFSLVEAAEKLLEPAKLAQSA